MKWDKELIEAELAGVKEIEDLFFANRPGRILFFRKTYEVDFVVHGLAPMKDIWVLVLEAKPGAYIRYLIADPRDAYDNGRDFNESDEALMDLWGLADINNLVAGRPASGITREMLEKAKERKMRDPRNRRH